VDLSSGVSVGQLLLSMSLILVTGGIAWGSITQRVKSLEREVETLAGLTERLTRIEEQTGFIRQEIGKLTTSWLFREPPGYDGLDRPSVQPTPRNRRPK
jgi:hypothetical protein